MSGISLSEPAGFSQMSKSDQIRYVQMLWDKIADNPDDVEVREGHWLELQDRLAEYRAHPERLTPARDVLDRLTNKHRK